MTTLTVNQVLEAAQIYDETVKNIQQRFIYLTYKLCDRVSELTHLSSVKGFYRQLSQCQREIECDESMSMDFACIQAFEPEHACFQKTMQNLAFIQQCQQLLNGSHALLAFGRPFELKPTHWDFQLISEQALEAMEQINAQMRNFSFISPGKTYLVNSLIIELESIMHKAQCIIDLVKQRGFAEVPQNPWELLQQWKKQVHRLLNDALMLIEQEKGQVALSVRAN
ncbi:hypothetical protein [Avibacterium sp. 21-594]|uniref:hypothetical protein n=1 Tax=Avibacterium sp. 21-594 TaxID=2911535 RepID=UPI002246DEF0|nr:hypothetical protein [Avibacterium sp. 21-594]MCW9716090.1 hypothetical protein [Avibacterium sp. 21-594]